MTVLVLADLATLANEVSAIAAINDNSTAIEIASHASLPKNGSEPMLGNLDVNSNRIINLPLPVANTEPVRKLEYDTLLDTIEVTITDAITDTATEIATTIATTIVNNAVNYIIPASMSYADVQAACALARTHSHSNLTTPTGSVTVYFNKPGRYVYANAILVGDFTEDFLGTPTPGLKFLFAPGVEMQKQLSSFSGNSLFQVAYSGRVEWEGGTFIGRGPSRTAGTINPAGDDCIRMYSCDNVTYFNMRFIDFGDTATRNIPFSFDTNIFERVWIDKCSFINCGQTSTTNSDGQVSAPYWFWFTNNFCKQMNSVKFASRNKTPTGLIINACQFEDCATGIEVDGYTNVHISNVYVKNCSGLYAISCIHNLFLGGVSNVDLANRWGITGIYIQGMIKDAAQGGVQVAPANQTRSGDNSDIYDQQTANVTINVSVENQIGTSSNTITLWGEYRNIKVDLQAVNCKGLRGIHYTPVVRNNVTYPHNATFNISGTFLRDSGTSGQIMFVDKDTQTTEKAKNIFINFNGIYATNYERLMYLYNTKCVYITAKGVEGGFASGFFFAQTYPNEDVYFDGFQAKNNANGLTLYNIMGLSLNNIDIEAEANHLYIDTTCGDARYGDNIKIRTSSTRLPADLVNSSLPGITSVSRATAVFTVTVAYSALTGYVGTDFTPTSGIAGFRCWTAGGVPVSIASAVRTNATTITVTATSDPGANCIFAYDDNFGNMRTMPQVYTQANTWRDNTARVIGLKPFKAAVA